MKGGSHRTKPILSLFSRKLRIVLRNAVFTALPLFVNMAGLLTCSGRCAFPTPHGSVAKDCIFFCGHLFVEVAPGTHSYGDSPGFSPDSLFIPFRLSARSGTNIWNKHKDSFQAVIVLPKEVINKLFASYRSRAGEYQ